MRFIDGKSYALYQRQCGEEDEWAWVPFVTDAKDLAEDVYDEVVKRLPKPAARFAPPADRVVVQLGTWFWVDPATWRPVSATAYIPGLSATVTATPTRLQLEPGDGAHGTGPISCDGPGPVWTPALGDEATSPCMYTYRHSSSLSPSGRWPAKVSIEWAVSFSASNGQASDLGTVPTSSTYAITVDEIQALLTN